jgi:hypothetical protein
VRGRRTLGRLARTLAPVLLLAALLSGSPYADAVVGPPPAPYALPISPGVTVVLAGQGLVTSGDQKITCGSVCTAPYRVGHMVTLSATPLQGSSFIGWSGGCFGTAPICLVVATATTTVRAHFSPVDGDLALTVGGPGVISSDPAGVSCGTGENACNVASFFQGQSVRLTPTPVQGSAFAGWGGACQQASMSACVVAVGTTTGVTATFRDLTPVSGPQPLSITSVGPPISAEPALFGPCAGFSTCNESVPSGTQLTLSGAFGWSGGCVGSYTACTLIVDAPTKVSGFAPLARHKGKSAGVPVQFSADPGGRLVADGFTCAAGTTCTHSFPNGAQIVVHAQATARGVRFVRWAGQFCTGSRPKCKLTVLGGQIVVAGFRR